MVIRVVMNVLLCLMEEMDASLLSHLNDDLDYVEERLSLVGVMDVSMLMSSILIKDK